MRTPTPMSELFSWHTAAIAGEKPTVFEGDPQMGWYKTRFVRGGPFVPARIWIKRDFDTETGELATPEEFICEVDGKPRDPYRTWTQLAGKPITRNEYAALIELRKTSSAMKATRVPIDLSEKATRP